jgi:hypothetical protein
VVEAERGYGDRNGRVGQSGGVEVASYDPHAHVPGELALGLGEESGGLVEGDEPGRGEPFGECEGGGAESAAGQCARRTSV